MTRVARQQIFDLGGIPNVVAAMTKFRRDADVQVAGAMVFLVCRWRCAVLSVALLNHAKNMRTLRYCMIIVCSNIFQRIHVLQVVWV